jgi:hypothetical protein
MEEAWVKVTNDLQEGGLDLCPFWFVVTCRLFASIPRFAWGQGVCRGFECL